MAKRSKKKGEDEVVEEEPRTVWKSKKGAATARGGRRGRGDAVLEEVDDAGPPREERGEEGDNEVVPEGDEGNPESFRVRNLHREVPRLANPTAVPSPACDGDDVGIRRSVVALTLDRSTLSDYNTVDSESDAVMPPA